MDTANETGTETGPEADSNKQTPRETRGARLRRRLTPGSGWLLGAGTGGGKARGILRVWQLFDRVLVHFTPMIPIPGAVDNVFKLQYLQYHGHPVTLPDGTHVGRGDSICWLHMNNSLLAHMDGQLSLLRAFRGDLQALARYVQRPEFPADVKAFYGYTLLSGAAPRLGFTVRPQRITIKTRLDRIFLQGLLAVYTPSGLNRLRRGSTYSRYPQEVWMSRAELLRRYGSPAHPELAAPVDA